jgi:methylase of polypeptide subunit release factors
VAADAVEQLGELLRKVGFGGKRHGELLSPGIAPPAEALEAVKRGDDARLATLLELFVDARALRRDRVEAAIESGLLTDLADEGLLVLDPTEIRSEVSLAMLDEMLVVADTTGEAPSLEMVQGVTNAAQSLASLTVRRQVDAALDLGTGSGVQALLASRHAGRVTGVDINPHALRLAGIAQRMNGVKNVTWKEGSWFSPVSDEHFGLIVGNPPYVISPDHAFIYRDSPTGADEICRQLVRDSAGHLVEGGFASFLCNWLHENDAWEEPLREWVADLGCDAVLMRHISNLPIEYATSWNRELATSDRSSFAATVERWVRHCERISAERIGSGAIVLRRRSGGSNWIRGFHTDRGPTGTGSDQLEGIFAGIDFLEAHAGAGQLRQLLSTAWRPVDGHRVDQTLIYEDGGYPTGHAVMVQVPGVGLNGRLDPRVLPVMIGLDGKRSLGQVIEDTPIPGGFDQAGFHTLCLDTVRDLIARGFLLVP